MKKVLLLLIAFSSFAFAQDATVAISAERAMIIAYSILGVSLGLGLAALGGAIGMGNVASSTIAGSARNPGMSGKLMTTMFIALAMIEAQVIYMLVITFIALYANPFL